MAAPLRARGPPPGPVSRVAIGRTNQSSGKTRPRAARVQLGSLDKSESQEWGAEWDSERGPRSLLTHPVSSESARSERTGFSALELLLPPPSLLLLLLSPRVALLIYRDSAAICCDPVAWRCPPVLSRDLLHPLWLPHRLVGSPHPKNRAHCQRAERYADSSLLAWSRKDANSAFKKIIIKKKNLFSV